MTPRARSSSMRGCAGRPALDGALRSSISQAMIRIHAEYYGKGATHAKTYACDNLVVWVLRDVLTTGEQTLVDVGRADTVRDVRTVFQNSMAATFRATVERLTGRRGASFMSQVDPANGLGVEVSCSSGRGCGGPRRKRAKKRAHVARSGASATHVAEAARARSKWLSV